MLSDRSVHGVEVLVRARGPNGEILGADQIVDAMVDGEAALGLTRAIMTKAVDEYAVQGFGALDIPFSFNIPLEGLLHPGLLGMLLEMRIADARRGRGITIELTERQPVRDVAAAGAVILALRGAGHEVLLDDITPDTENLDELLETPLSAVKLDGSVVNSGSARDHDFMQRIVAWGHDKGAGVIAEGIETEAVAARMLDYRIGYGQGFLYAKPMTAVALRGFLEGRQQRKPA